MQVSSGKAHVYLIRLPDQHPGLDDIAIASERMRRMHEHDHGSSDNVGCGGEEEINKTEGGGEGADGRVPHEGASWLE